MGTWRFEGKEIRPARWGHIVTRCTSLESIYFHQQIYDVYLFWFQACLDWNVSLTYLSTSRNWKRRASVQIGELSFPLLTVILLRLNSEEEMAGLVWLGFFTESYLDFLCGSQQVSQLH